MRSRVILAVMTVSLFCTPVLGADKGGLYKLDKAPFTVGTVPLVKLHDTVRDRDVQVRAVYPKAEEKFPVILFSHLVAGARDEYDALAGFWAAHGYICLLPDHADSTSALAGESDPAKVRETVRKNWRDRPLDLRFLLDSLGEMERQVPELNGKPDREFVGVGGHYIGSRTAGELGGMRVFDPSGRFENFTDPRVRAVLMLSPTGREGGTTEKSWAEMKVPMLVMTGSKDPSTRSGNAPEWRTEPFRFAPPGDKYLVFIEGLTEDYGGLINNIARQSETEKQEKSDPVLAAYVQASTLAFWDAHLKNSQEARAYLESDRLPTFSRGKVRLEHK
ncbi:MAG: hypothetical protein L0Y32_00900 [Nevskiales bacterium]|nr:hypothetical protein [Nevskiales bacterium]